jgi:hypothetical protein
MIYNLVEKIYYRIEIYDLVYYCIEIYELVYDQIRTLSSLPMPLLSSPLGT